MTEKDKVKSKSPKYRPVLNWPYRRVNHHCAMDDFWFYGIINVPIFRSHHDTIWNPDLRWKHIREQHLPGRFKGFFKNCNGRKSYKYRTKQHLWIMFRQKLDIGSWCNGSTAGSDPAST